MSLCLLAFFLGGCGASAEASEVEAFQDEKGAYVLWGLEWGITPKEAEKQLEIPMEGPLSLKGADMDFDVYTVETMDFMGEEWTFQCQFSEDGLFIGGFFLQGTPRETGKRYEKLAKALENCYGPPDPGKETAEENRKLLVWTAPDGDGRTELNLHYKELGVDGLAAVSLGAAYWAEP